MHATTLTLALLLAGTAYAQSTTSTAPTGAPTRPGEASPCVMKCIYNAAELSGCSCSSNHRFCMCKYPVLQIAVNCIQDACPDDIERVGWAAQQVYSDEEIYVTYAVSSTASSITYGAKELGLGEGGMWGAGVVIAGAAVGGWIL